MMIDWLPQCYQCATSPTVDIIVDDKYGFHYPHCQACATALVRVFTTRHPEIQFHTESLSLPTQAAA